MNLIYKRFCFFFWIFKIFFVFFNYKRKVEKDFNYKGSCFFFFWNFKFFCFWILIFWFFFIKGGLKRIYFKGNCFWFWIFEIISALPILITYFIFALHFFLCFISCIFLPIHPHLPIHLQHTHIIHPSNCLPPHIISNPFSPFQTSACFISLYPCISIN